VKYISLFFLFLVSSFASTISIPEKALADDLKVLLALYKKSYSDVPVENWNQLGAVTKGFDGINSSLKSGSVTDCFSFIPLGQRDRFPKGKLILVQFKAMPWPDVWRSEDPKNLGKYLQHPSQQEIRFLIYEKNGRFYSEHWYETKFQAMLAETGLTIPPPTPYYPPSPTPPGKKPDDVPSAAAHNPEPKTAHAVAPAIIPTPAPSASGLAKLSNTLWWLVGTLVALVAVVLIVRRKK
jgi:hypothetical protein